MNSFEDLAPLLVPKGPAAGNVTFKQGVVQAWNTATGANTVRVAGTDFADLPLVDSSDLVLISPGDVVGILVVTSGSGGFATMFIIGRATGVGDPGIGAAAAFVEDLIDRRTEEATVSASQATTSTGYTDLATVGPAVTIDVRASGRIQVTVSALLTYSNTAGGLAGGAMGFALSGSNTAAANDPQSLFAGFNSATTAGIDLGSSRVVVLSGLTPGATTVTCKYRTRGTSCSFRDRHLAVVAL